MQIGHELAEAFIVTKYRRSGISRPQKIKVGPNCSKIEFRQRIVVVGKPAQWEYVAKPSWATAYPTWEEAAVASHRANVASLKFYAKMLRHYGKKAKAVLGYCESPKGGPR